MRKSCADFAVWMCVRACAHLTLSVPFSLLHVSPQARSGVSVPVTGDQTISVRLGVEPQCCVTARSTGAAEIWAIRKACRDLNTVASCCLLDSQMAHEPIHQHGVTWDRGLLVFPWCCKLWGNRASNESRHVVRSESEPATKLCCRR